MPCRPSTTGLYPADLPKEAASFDLPIALGIMANSGQIAAERLDHYAVVGGWALDDARGPSRRAMAKATGCLAPSPQAGRRWGRRLNLLPIAGIVRQHLAVGYQGRLCYV